MLEMIVNQILLRTAPQIFFFKIINSFFLYFSLEEFCWNSADTRFYISQEFLDIDLISICGIKFLTSQNVHFEENKKWIYFIIANFYEYTNWGIEISINWKKKKLIMKRTPQTNSE